MPTKRARILSIIVGLAVSGATALAPPLASAEPSDPGRYIVRTVPGTDPSTTINRSARGADVSARYHRVLNGFAAELTGGEVELLRDDPGVVSVTADQAITINDDDVTITPAANQPTPPWGLDRIDQRKRPGDGRYTYSTTGQGVTAFVIDTGIRFSHQEFEGRAK